MLEKYFSSIEAAVSPSNIAITIIGAIFASLILGAFLGNIRKSLRDGLLSFLIFELLFIVLYISVKDNVSSYRYRVIKETMLKININNDVENRSIEINSWFSGLKAIEKCPSEVGYYLITTDYLEKEKDYESAALLIELGLDFIRQSPIPPPLCKKLRIYYKHLKNKPEITKDCKTFIENKVD